jgi:hypothetical protein
MTAVVPGYAVNEEKKKINKKKILPKPMQIDGDESRGKDGSSSGLCEEQSGILEDRIVSR